MPGTGAGHFCPLGSVSPGTSFLSVATLVVSGVVPAISSLQCSEAGWFWQAEGLVSRTEAPRKPVPTRLPQKLESDELELVLLWGNYLKASGSLLALCEGRALGAGDCLWPTQLLGRWPAILTYPEALMPLGAGESTHTRLCRFCTWRRVLHLALGQGQQYPYLSGPCANWWCKEDTGSHAAASSSSCFQLHWCKPVLRAGLAT